MLGKDKMLTIKCYLLSGRLSVIVYSLTIRAFYPLYLPFR